MKWIRKLKRVFTIYGTVVEYIYFNVIFYNGPTKLNSIE